MPVVVVANPKGGVGKSTLATHIAGHFAARAFLDQLAAHQHADRIQVGLVGMRVDARTLASDKLHEFLDQLGVPVLGYLRDTQNYIHLAARGLTLFDLVPSPAEKDLAQWERIGQWLES